MSLPTLVAIRSKTTQQALTGFAENPIQWWYLNRSRLRKGTHPKTSMQAAWAERGEADFEFLQLGQFASAATAKAHAQAHFKEFPEPAARPEYPGRANWGRRLAPSLEEFYEKYDLHLRVKQSPHWRDEIRTWDRPDPADSPLVASIQRAYKYLPSGHIRDILLRTAASMTSRKAAPKEDWLVLVYCSMRDIESPIPRTCVDFAEEIAYTILGDSEFLKELNAWMAPRSEKIRMSMYPMLKRNPRP